MRSNKYNLTPEQLEIAKRNGIKLNTLYYRLEAGYSIMDALCKKPDRTHLKVKGYSVKEVAEAEKLGISKETLYRRKREGWKKKDALTIIPEYERRKKGVKN
jgi:hypothetical protein